MYMTWAVTVHQLQQVIFCLLELYLFNAWKQKVQSVFERCWHSGLSLQITARVPASDTHFVCVYTQGASFFSKYSFQDRFIDIHTNERWMWTLFTTRKLSRITNWKMHCQMMRFVSMAVFPLTCFVLILECDIRKWCNRNGKIKKEKIIIIIYLVLPDAKRVNTQHID